MVAERKVFNSSPIWLQAIAEIILECKWVGAIIVSSYGILLNEKFGPSRKLESRVHVFRQDPSNCVMTPKATQNWISK